MNPKRICLQCGGRQAHGAKCCRRCRYGPVGERQKRRAEYMVAYQKEYTRTNAERARQRARDWYYANPEQRRETGKRYRALNHEILRAKKAAYNKANPEKNRARVEAYFRANPQMRAAYSRDRRARERAAGGNGLSRNIVSVLLVAQNGLCAACKTRIFKGWVHVDHIVALARGGPHDDSNAQLLCPPCNAGKRDRDFGEFLRSKGFE